MENRNRNEKDEKELRKHEEKDAEEKQWDEKWNRDPLSGIIWAGILIWAGIVLLAGNLGVIDTLIKALPGEPTQYADVNTWSFIFLGAGLLLLAEALVRLLMPEYRTGVNGNIILGFVFVGIGLSDLISSGVVWALIIIGAGVIMLLRGVMGNR